MSRSSCRQRSYHNTQQHNRCTASVPESTVITTNSCGDKHPPSKTPVGVLPWTRQSDGKSDRLSGKAALTNGLLLGRSEVLRNLRHYLRAQSQGHHTIDRPEERGVDTESARRSYLKGRERSIVNQTNVGTVLKATLGKLLRDWVGRIWVFPSTWIPS